MNWALVWLYALGASQMPDEPVHTPHAFRNHKQDHMLHSQPCESCRKRSKLTSPHTIRLTNTCLYPLLTDWCSFKKMHLSCYRVPLL